MMNHARKLMDADYPTMRSIGYLLWNSDGRLTPEQLDDVAKLLLSIDVLDEETLQESFDIGYKTGYSDGKEAERSKEKKEADQTQIASALMGITR